MLVNEFIMVMAAVHQRSFPLSTWLCWHGDGGSCVELLVGVIGERRGNQLRLVELKMGRRRRRRWFSGRPALGLIYDAFWLECFGGGHRAVLPLPVLLRCLTERRK